MPSVRRFFPTVVFSFGSREVERRDSLFLDMIFWEKGLRKSLFSPASIFTRSFYCQWERSINNNEGFGFLPRICNPGSTCNFEEKAFGSNLHPFIQMFSLPGTAVSRFSRINDARSSPERNSPFFSAVRSFIRRRRTFRDSGLSRGGEWKRMGWFSGLWVLNQAGGKPGLFLPPGLSGLQIRYSLPRR